MAVRTLLRSLVDGQVAAVNGGDTAALGKLLHGASTSWRIPRLPGASMHGGEGQVSDSVSAFVLSPPFTA